MYLWLKLIHVAAVVAFVGNIATGLFWHAHAARTRDPRTLAVAMDGIIRSDQLFTVPGVVIIIASGVWLALEAGFPLFRTFWIGWSLVLFGISGVLFMWRIAPMQQQLRAMARTGAESGSFDYVRYAALARRWDAWGVAALVTPLGALALMVLKPARWGG